MPNSNLREGDADDFEEKEPDIIAARVRPSLNDLVAEVTPENQHDETDWGNPRGGEVW